MQNDQPEGKEHQERLGHVTRVPATALRFLSGSLLDDSPHETLQGYLAFADAMEYIPAQVGQEIWPEIGK